MEVKEPIAKVQDDPPLYSVDRGTLYICSEQYKYTTNQTIKN